MRLALAILVAFALSSIGIGMMRSLGARRPRITDAPAPAPPPANVRITYRCETCGTELIVSRTGSEAAPRHCGEPMRKREEIAR